MLEVLELGLLAAAQLALVAVTLKLARRYGEIDGTVFSARSQLADEAAAMAMPVKAALTTTEVLDAGVAGVQSVHKSIASIPFDVLESIPATRDASKVVRGVHDAISGGVYGLISGVNRELGSRLEKHRHSGRPQPPPSPEGDGAQGKKDGEGG